jgi:hypothetical protein
VKLFWKTPEGDMLYKLASGLHGSNLILVLTVMVLFLAITITKEKRDERKRA